MSVSETVFEEIFDQYIDTPKTPKNSISENKDFQIIPEECGNFKGCISIRTYIQFQKDKICIEYFMKLILFLAPNIRKYDKFKFDKTFKERCIEENLDQKYLNCFDQIDLDSFYLKEPSIFDDGSLAWFIFFDSIYFGEIYNLLKVKIDEFVENK